MSTYVREPGDWKESWENFKPEELCCTHCGKLYIHEDNEKVLITVPTRSQRAVKKRSSHTHLNVDSGPAQNLEYFPV